MVDYEAIAMTELERKQPQEVKRFDTLRAKEKTGIITEDEKTELNFLDMQLKAILERYILHYAGNWMFLSTEQKQELIKYAKKRKEDFWENK